MTGVETIATQSGEWQLRRRYFSGVTALSQIPKVEWIQEDERHAQFERPCGANLSVQQLMEEVYSYVYSHSDELEQCLSFQEIIKMLMIKSVLNLKVGYGT